MKIRWVNLFLEIYQAHFAEAEILLQHTFGYSVEFIENQ